MPVLPPQFRFPTTPVASPQSVVLAGNARFTVLTESLVRLEYSPTATFENRATQTVINRALPTPQFRVARDGERTQVFTSHFHLDHTGGEFTPESLSVKQLAGGYHSVWRPGQEPESKFSQYVGIPTQLGGTARTLDAVDGPTELENGLANSLGITSLDDSYTLALVDDWVAPRVPGNVDVYVFAHGRDYAAAVADFYRIAGSQPVLPRWALGNWWSRYHPYTDVEYRELVERFAVEKLPFSVAVVDMDWHLTDIPERYGAGWTGYTWNPELFPDHVEFLAWLHEQGLKVSLNVHPAEGVRGFEEAYPRVAEAVGIDPASDLPVTFDIADPSFVRAYFEQLHHPLEADGVDFWWLDWQQGSTSRIPGLDPLWMLNHLHFLDSGRDGRRPITFSRYAGPGSHRYPIGFSGDTVISWESLDFQPYFTSTASNIGYGWWSHDIGGHMFGHKDDELATRWVQFGALSPINRLHSSNGTFFGKEPWRHGPVAEQVMGEFLRLRHRMLPWLFTENEAGSRELRPLVRPLYWSEPDEPRAYQVPNQYWFGRDLLVAAITEPTRPVTRCAPVAGWLPEGHWVDLFTGVAYQGGRAVTFWRPINQVPVLARAGAIVPFTGPDELGAGLPASLELQVAAGADGSYTLYEDDDMAEPRAVRTRFEFRHETGELVVHPAEGDLDLLPETRRITAVLLGAGAPRRLDLGEVATATGATGRFDGAAGQGAEGFGFDNRIADRALALLDGFQCEFMLKQRIHDMLVEHDSSAARMARLLEFELPDDLLGVLTELVLALD